MSKMSDLRIKELEEELMIMTQRYEHVSADRLAYIDLWCQVPIKQRMKIQEKLLKKLYEEPNKKEED